MTLLSWLPLGIAIVVFLGASVTFLRGSADKGTITSLKDSVSAYQTRVALLEQQVNDLTTKMTAAETRANALEKVVTQQNEVAHLQSTLDRHHVESMEELRAIEAALRSTP